MKTNNLTEAKLRKNERESARREASCRVVGALDWVSIGLLWVIAAGLPLVFSYAAKNPNLAKPVALSLSLALLLALAVYKLLLGLQMHLQFNLLDIAVGVYLVVVLISWLYSDNEAVTRAVIMTSFLQSTLYFLIRYEVKQWITLVRIVEGLLLGSCIVSAIGIGQQLGYFSWNAPWWVGSTWFNRTYLAPYLLMVLPVAIWAAIYSRGFRRWVGVAASGECLITLIFTGARAAWLGLVPILIIFVVGALLLSAAKKKAVLVRVFMLSIIVLSVSLIMVTRYAPSISLITRSKQALDLKNRDNPLFLSYWTAAVAMGIKHPIIGWGAGTYSIYAPHFVPKYYWRYGVPLITDAHNEPLQVFAELGLIGVISFLALPVVAFYMIVRETKKTDSAVMEHRTLLIALLAGIIGFMAAGLVSVSARVPGESALFYLLLGLISAGVAQNERLVTKSKERRDQTGSLISAVVLSILCAVCLLIYKSDLDHVRASRYLLRGEFMMTQQNNAASAIFEFREACRYIPQSPEAWYDLGNAYAMTKDYTSALYAYNKVESLAPDYARVHFNQGTVMIQAGRFADAKQELEKAYELDGMPDTAERLAYVNSRLYGKVEIR